VRRSLLRWLGAPVLPAAEKEPNGALRREMRRLEVRARQAMEAGLSGQYRSAFRGRGLEFEEVREYRWGDDVRTIDWNVTARSGELHVKLFREERDLTVLLLVDLSASTRFGSGALTVHDTIAEVASLFSLAAARRDRVGAVLFDDGIRALIPPRRGWRHGLSVAREVLVAEPAGEGTAFAAALEAAGRLLHRRGVVVAVVDAACPMPERDLRAVAARHEVVMIRVSDPLIEEGSPVPLPVRSAEGRGRGILHGPVRRETGPVPGRVDVVDIRTDGQYLPAVQELLRRRERRRAS